MQRLVVMAHLVVAFPVWAGAAPANYVLCKLKGNVRSVRIEVDASNICHTIYSKEGVDKTLGSGKNVESCKKILDNVRANLGKSNWTCRDVATATASGGT